jgi:nitrite reductase/ring-hydroxylating ferredoxin subunit
MARPNRRLLELDRQLCESSKWSWLDDVVQTRSAQFVEDMGHGALGHSWVFVCEGSSIQEPGEFFTDEIAGRLVLVCRNQAGRLKGFRNVCPHLGAPVERNRHGHTRSFTCPYHAWMFSLDGHLTSVPLPEGYAGSGFQKELFGLPEISTAQVGSLVFGTIQDDLADDDLADPAAYFEAATPYLQELFPSQAEWEVIFHCSLRTDLGWQEWMQRSRQAYADGTMAPALLGLSQAEYCQRRELIHTSQGHQIVVLPELNRQGLERRYGLSTQAWARNQAEPGGEQRGRIVHLAPNLLVAQVGDALVTLRPDPLDEHISVVRVQGYGHHGETPAQRHARLAQIQLWWGPAGEQLQMALE